MTFFFFNDTATTEIYTLSLHDALPIYAGRGGNVRHHVVHPAFHPGGDRQVGDRKSTRLNSSHSQISYAVFCLKKKKQNKLLLDTSITITNNRVGLHHDGTMLNVSRT